MEIIILTLGAIMEMLSQKLLDACDKVFNGEMLSIIDENVCVNELGLLVFNFLVSDQKLSVPTILGKKQVDGFVVNDEYGEVSRHFTESSLIAFLVQKCFKECFTIYENAEQAKGLSEFYNGGL